MSIVFTDNVVLTYVESTIEFEPVSVKVDAFSMFKSVKSSSFKASSKI